MINLQIQPEDIVPIGAIRACIDYPNQIFDNYQEIHKMELITKDTIGALSYWLCTAELCCPNAVVKQCCTKEPAQWCTEDDNETINACCTQV